MVYSLDDTIAAISTPVGNGGIAIIRLSGVDALSIVDKIFEKKPEKFESHKIYYGHIKDENGVIDEVLLSVMLAPKTYTRQDVVEINCHGGVVSSKRVLEACIKNGARLAEPGEFTKRAFLNGRIDLSQAEAVADIINSKTDLAQKVAVNKLSGTLSNKVSQMREEIILLLAHIEAAIDYPEHDIEDMTYAQMQAGVSSILADVDKLILSADRGKIIKEGINTVILGKTNVGKSSLLNVLLDEQRAIVTDIAGTTRDILTESINIKGIMLNMIDTAGIRQTEDTIEKIGIEKSKQYAQNADLILVVFDLSRPFSDEDNEILSLCENKKAIAVVNKADLEQRFDTTKLKNLPTITISAKENKGIEALEDEIYKLFSLGEISSNEEMFIYNQRNKESLFKAKKYLLNVLETIENRMPEDFISMDLTSAYAALGEIIGQALDEDLIDKIFSEFCLGK